MSSLKDRVGSEKVVNRDQERQRMPYGENFGPGVIPVLLPGQIVPVEQVEPVGEDRHHQDAVQRDRVRQRPGSQFHGGIGGSHVETPAAGPAEVVGEV